MSNFKKIIFLSVIFSLVYNATFSQVSFLLGNNVSFLTIKKEGYQHQIPRFGLVGGIRIDLKLNYENYLEIGAFYSQHGMNYTRSFFEDTANVKYKESYLLDYAKVAIYYKQTFAIPVYTKIGAYFSYLIHTNSGWKEKFNYPNGTKRQFEGKYRYFDKNLKNFDFGLSAGGGYIYSINNKFDLCLELTGNIGFVQLNSIKDIEDNEKFYNRFFTLSIIFVKKKRESRFNLR